MTLLPLIAYKIYSLGTLIIPSTALIWHLEHAYARVALGEAGYADLIKKQQEKEEREQRKEKNR